MGYSPWGRKVSDMTELFHFHQSRFSVILWLPQFRYLNFLHERSLKYRFKLSSSHLEPKDNDFSIWPNDIEVWAL